MRSVVLAAVAMSFLIAGGAQVSANQSDAMRQVVVLVCEPPPVGTPPMPPPVAGVAPALEELVAIPVTVISASSEIPGLVLGDECAAAMATLVNHGFAVVNATSAGFAVQYLFVSRQSTRGILAH